MEGNERRKLIVNILTSSVEPVSGSKLAKKVGVSRQVVVQDIALLRVAGYEIEPTTKGYIISRRVDDVVRRTFCVKHTNEQIEDELCTIVDFGGRALDVKVMHPIYGDITTELGITNRAQIYEFVKKVEQQKTKPLKELTDGEHSHTVEASTNEQLDQIEAALREKKYLIQ